MTLLFMFTAMLVVLLAEFLFGSCGLYVPLVGIMIFYFTVSCGWQNGLLAAVVCGSALDMLYGREIILSPWLFLLPTALGAAWGRKHNTAKLSSVVLPALLLPVVILTPWHLLNIYRHGIGIYLLKEALPQLITAAALCALVMPPLTAILDKLARRLGLPQYRQSGKS